MTKNILYILAFWLYASNSFAQNCPLPEYSLLVKEASSIDTKDGRITAASIKNATHFQISTTGGADFNFATAKPLPPNTINYYLDSLINPTVDTKYIFRLYNGSANCYRDREVILYRLNYIADRNFAEIEIIQTIDNPTPKIGDIVTFTTFVRNIGVKTSETIGVNFDISNTLIVNNFFVEKGTYTQGINYWNVGILEGGRSVKMVARFKVSAVGLSYYNSYVSNEGNKKYTFSEAQAVGIEKARKSAINCVSVPVEIKASEVYTVTLKNYVGVKWYFKDNVGNFTEVTANTANSIAVINKDSSLTIRQSGEYSFSKKTANCNITSCCPIIVSSCSGPNIIPDSVYCNSTVDSYNIIVRLEDDKYSLIESVFMALSTINYPMMNNYLKRVNVLPLTSSAGLVSSLGKGKYLISNIPAFMPNVTLVSTDIQGKCKNVRIVNAPNCNSKPLGIPQIKDNILYVGADMSSETFRVLNKEEKADIVWSSDELGLNLVNKGKKFKTKTLGAYYVAFRDKKTKAMGASVKVELRPVIELKPGKFDTSEICDCENNQMIPRGEIENEFLSTAYPNPVSDILTVDFEIPRNIQIAELMFVNINGRLIHSEKIISDQKRVQVDVSKWADGMYVYSIMHAGKRVISQRVAVVH
jgi:hypothetical protein